MPLRPMKWIAGLKLWNRDHDHLPFGPQALLAEGFFMTKEKGDF